MRTTLKRLRRVATVLVALGAVTAAAGIPSASAAADDYCGTNVANDGVYMRACWLRSGSEGVYYAGAKMRIPSPLNANVWSSCTIRIAVFKKPASSSSYSRIQTGVGDCTQNFKDNSTNNTAFYMADTRAVAFEPKACYYVVSRWFAYYNGTKVGMWTSADPLPYSSTLCGPATSFSAVDDGVLGVTPVVETPEAPAVAPFVPVV